MTFANETDLHKYFQPIVEADATEDINSTRVNVFPFGLAHDSVMFYASNEHEFRISEKIRTEIEV